MELAFPSCIFFFFPYTFGDLLPPSGNLRSFFPLFLSIGISSPSELLLKKLLLPITFPQPSSLLSLTFKSTCLRYSGRIISLSSSCTVFGLFFSSFKCQKLDTLQFQSFWYLPSLGWVVSSLYSLRCGECSDAYVGSTCQGQLKWVRAVSMISSSCWEVDSKVLPSCEWSYCDYQCISRKAGRAVVSTARSGASCGPKLLALMYCSRKRSRSCV